VKYSVLLLTYNELDNLEGFMRSVPKNVRVCVVDSGSTDGTLELLATKYPHVDVLYRKFDGFSGQRNYGLNKFFSEGTWVLHLDADERMTRGLHAELRSLVPGENNVAYNIAALNTLYGKPVRRAAAYPVYQTRLSLVGSFEFVEVGHGQKAPKELGALPCLRNPYRHLPFSKGLKDWFERHNRYSDIESKEIEENTVRYSFAAGLKDPIAFRQWLKSVTRDLPARPLLIYLYLMIWRRGVTEGPAGWDYCRLRAIYEQMIDMKRRELRTTKKNQEVTNS